jgi:hypothetical protein
VKWLLIALLSFSASAEEKNIPYLGPGAEQLSANDYERIYKNYIQTSVLLGYPFLQDRAAPCEHALNAVFRQVGMFAYPVPQEAQQITRATRRIKGQKVESYEMAGVLLQLVRDGKTDILDRLVMVNSASPKASRRLSQIVKQEILTLEKDEITGLERVKGIPVGYPHPFLSAEGQGLFVKVLEFNKKREGCLPLAFTDNSWLGGFDLNEARCSELQTDVEQVWKEKLAPNEFAERELKRLKEKAYQNALGRGAKPEQAKALVEKHFTLPLTNEVNLVGQAMRSLAQCNLLALGRQIPGQKGASEPSGTGQGDSKGSSSGAQ